MAIISLQVYRTVRPFANLHFTNVLQFSFPSLLTSSLLTMDL